MLTRIPTRYPLPSLNLQHTLGQKNLSTHKKSLPRKTSIQGEIPRLSFRSGESSGEMACASQSLLNMTISANSCTFNASPRFLYRRCPTARKHDSKLVVVRASADESDCNKEECAPDKEVGKVSMEWLAGEKTMVVGTFPPRKRGWTGYVEKDTAGQTNIYSVEPTVYLAESAISSGSAGSSSNGAENTVAIAGGVALIFVAAAFLVLRQVGNNEPLVQTAEYSGPSLSYYIDKFKPPEIIQALAPPLSEPATSVQAQSPDLEFTQIQAATGDQTEASS